MSNRSRTFLDFGTIEKDLATLLDNARSLEEIEASLKSQLWVESVQLADYVLKSEPPQRDFVIEFKLQNGSSVKKVVNIFDLGNQKFRFRSLRDQ